MLQQVAQWNKTRDVWETGEMDLFSEHSGVFSETWPKSGMTRNGVLFLRPGWEHRTGGNESSSSRGLLRTPCAAEAEGGMIHPDKAEREGRTLRLSSQIVHMVAPDQLRNNLLPTPRTNDHTGPGEHGRGGRDLRTEIAVTDFAEFAPAVDRWEKVIGRKAPSPTLVNARGNHQLSGRFVEWMMGLPDGWVTSPDIGLSRAQQLKALGNGVVPQQAKAAIELLLPRRKDG